MKKEIINVMKLFSRILGNDHIPRQELIIPRSDLKIIRSMYNVYTEGKSKIKYRDFLCQVESMSIEYNTHYLKMAEIIAKSI